MKKALIIISLLAFTAVSFGQNLQWQVAKGAVGVDSIVGGTPTVAYYYLNSAAADGKTKAAKPISSHDVYAIQAGTVRSVITGTDSCHIELEVSLDNSNWVEYTATTPTVFGGGTYVTVLTCVTTTTNGGGVWTINGLNFPYVRVKFSHYKAACNMYPQAWATMSRVY